jgi:hypothetical protein
MVANKKKTPLRSTPSRKRNLDLDAFAAGAGKKSTKAEECYPWEDPRVRDDVKKNLLVRMPEPLYMKLKYIAENTPYSMNSFILEKITEKIEEEIDRLN